MLYTKTVSKVVIEHRGVHAVDDVVVYYAPPGVNDNGETVSVDFHQLKFHTAQTGAIRHEALVDPAWTGTKEPILKRFSDEWKKIVAEHPSARLNFVTNWPWDPNCHLARFIRDSGAIDPAFLQQARTTTIGKIRESWRIACGLTEDHFPTFLAALRFSHSAVSQSESEDWLRDRCQLAGLVPVPSSSDWSPYDDLGKRLIESGRTEFTPAGLRALVEKQSLLANPSPFRSTLAIRSFTRSFHVPDTDGACIVDLTDLFEGRAIRSAEDWNGRVKKRLETAMQAVDGLAEPIHVALDAHLSISWYAGYLLDPKSGKRVVLRQKIRGKGIEIWDVSAARRPDGEAEWKVAQSSRQGGGSELAVVVSVTHSALADAEKAIVDSLPLVGSVMHAEAPTPGHQAVRDGAHARWLADELVRIVNAKAAAMRPARVHLFMACPASVAFLLGQDSHVLGPMTVYEYDFGNPERAYRPGITT